MLIGLQVIIPIISAALADGEQLIRVIVLKPLCVQMFHLLKQRICGLANRRLFYLPFSRSVSLDMNSIPIICDMFKECARVGGVLLCQPEHILSFQLMGLHVLCSTKDIEKAKPFLDAQRWLDDNARDILDESDEILNERYQLIYTLGIPEPLQGQPDRWQVIQTLFSLLKKELGELATAYPDGVEVETVQAHRFPRTRIIGHECGQSLLKSIADQIVFKKTIFSTPFRTYPPEMRTLAFQFITEIKITQDDNERLQEQCSKSFELLLLLRGLIAHGVILSGLEKRWRVDYGLDPSRSMLAVPYRAKDCPAPRAEFGHPDMIIVLTCLSYYYNGLSNQQLEETFHQLYYADDPSLRYEDWIKGLPNIPDNLRSLRALNLHDDDQKYSQIFPRLRDNKAVIDFYLSECVFPKEAREFQYKLTTNVWDLARTKAKLTTGFSGTNDNKYLLPLSINQLDSADQRHTNAQVLDYLLHVENDTVVCTGSNVTAVDLIELVVEQKHHVTVLLDVGAQVLELQNKDVAREWLNRDTTVEAAVYCDSSDDEFYVRRRDGNIEPLRRSPYRSQLNKVLVYLDEARTRGTDFKFPSGSRAAVTLGPKLCKDKLVQGEGFQIIEVFPMIHSCSSGCMRMRRLGSDHSVLFIASREIRRKIQPDENIEIHSRDVLIWTMLETLEQIKNNGPHWASQGLNFDNRCRAWRQYDRDSQLSALTNVLQEKESRSLEELYGTMRDDALDMWPLDGVALSETQRAIQEKCEKFGISLSRNSALLEEQEKELAHEKEAERQVQRVSASSPLDHDISPGLYTFTRWGFTSTSFVSLIECLEYTSHGSSLLTTTKSFFQSVELRATRDFLRTIDLGESFGGFMDDFLRPVKWILRSRLKPNMLLLISPFEANVLLPEIRESRFVQLTLYSPRVSRQATSDIEDLNFFVVPPSIKITPPASRTIQELNIFAGQLFFRDRPAFKTVCSMLGLHLGEIPDNLEGKVDPDGFVTDEAARKSLGIQKCPFHASAIPFLRKLIGWRRKGQGYSITHMGQIVCGNDLDESEFD